MHRVIKSLLFGLSGLVLLFPALQAKFKWLPERPLNGAYVTAPRAEFSVPKLLDNKYQAELERYLEDRIGFRSLFIQLRNQLSYSIFNESHDPSMAIGRHKVLFEKYAITAWQGSDFAGEEQVKFNSQLFRVVQDSLARHGVKVVFVLAPNKASFMPENLPAGASEGRSPHDHYTEYVKELTARGVNLLDFNKAFRQWRATSPYPLFTSGGTHWSIYGGVKAGDSLLSYIQHISPYTPKRFTIQSVQFSDTPLGTDDDIAKTMNLLLPRPPERLAYPVLAFPDLPPTQRPPKALLISDSFGWTWINTFFPQCFSEQSSFWHYNKSIAWTGNGQYNQDIESLRTRENYLSQDIIIVMTTAANLWEFDKGFSRQAFNVLQPITAADTEFFNYTINELRRTATKEEAAKENFEQQIQWRAIDIRDRRRLFQNQAQ